MQLKDHIDKVKAMNRNPCLLSIEDKVLILPDSPEEVSKGGIIIPDTAKEQQTKGLVIAIGIMTLSGSQQQVKVGDRVLYSKFAGNDLEVGEFKLRAIRHGDISAVIEQAQIANEQEFTKKDNL